MAPQYFYIYVVNHATSFLSFISGPPSFLDHGPPGFFDLFTPLFSIKIGKIISAIKKISGKENQSCRAVNRSKNPGGHGPKYLGGPLIKLRKEVA